MSANRYINMYECVDTHVGNEVIEQFKEVFVKSSALYFTASVTQSGS